MNTDLFNASGEGKPGFLRVEKPGCEILEEGLTSKPAIRFARDIVKM